MADSELNDWDDEFICLDSECPCTDGVHKTYHAPAENAHSASQEPAGLQDSEPTGSSANSGLIAAPAGSEEACVQCSCPWWESLGPFLGHTCDGLALPEWINLREPDGY